jgi:tryptophanyl-tRNA synthetase
MVLQTFDLRQLGNYLGALANWVKLQDTADPQDDLLFMIVGWHALTLPQNPKELTASRWDMLATLLAVGLDPNRSVIFHQDHVCNLSYREELIIHNSLQNQDHLELAWFMNCVTPVGRLFRMTTWKSRIAASRNAEESDVDETLLNAGLLTYPLLQAADILLYRYAVVLETVN